jgi:hypothetical protein
MISIVCCSTKVIFLFLVFVQDYISAAIWSCCLVGRAVELFVILFGFLFIFGLGLVVRPSCAS